MNLLFYWVAALIAALGLFGCCQEIYRQERAKRKAYKRGAADARLEIQKEVWREVIGAMSDEERADLLARLEAEQRRRGEA